MIEEILKRFKSKMPVSNEEISDVLRYVLEKVEGRVVDQKKPSLFDVMISDLNSMAYKSFYRFYTEKRIVEACAEVNELPSWMKTMVGSKKSKIDYLIENYKN